MKKVTHFFKTGIAVAKMFLLALIIFQSQRSFSQTPVCATPGADGAQEFPTPSNSFFPGAQDNVIVAAGSKSLELLGIPDPFVVGGTLYGFGSSKISKGDLLLIIQMQGADFNAENNNKYGSGVGDGSANGRGSGYTNLNNVGRYEYAVSLSDVPTAGGTLNFKASGPGGGLLFSYQNKTATAAHGEKRFQVIRLMQYSDLKLTSNITTTPWNGKAGGLIAIDVAGTFDFNNHVIDASMTGFRGGYMPVRTIENVNYSPYFTIDSHGTTKGEGIAGVPRYVWDGYNFIDQGAGWIGYPGGDYGRGAPGNAGGGGNVHNAGGGGGGNAGTGGAGGYGWPLNNYYPQYNTPESALTGGRPGASLPSAVSTGLIFMGGGGGGGDANNAENGVKGGVGGGIVIITANKIVGNGYILANGGRGEAGRQGGSADGAGGGGAGGTVFIKVKETSPTANLSIQARGGNGGNSYTTTLHGPGGGGGGGTIHYYANGANIAANVIGGQSGRINDGNPIDLNGYTPYVAGTNVAKNGAEDGVNGVVNSYSLTDLPPYLSHSANCYPVLSVVKERQNPLMPIPAGSTITYKMTVTNTSGGAAGVRVRDELPANFKFIAATIDFSGAGTPQTINNMGTSDIPVLGPFNLPTETYAVIEMKVNVPFTTPEGTYHNAAQVGYLDPTRKVTDQNRIIYPPTNALPGQNTTYMAGDEVISGRNYHQNDEGEEVVVVKPEIGIFKVIDNSCADTVNGNVYSITVFNDNAVELNNIEVTDIIDNDLEVIGMPSGSGWSISHIGNTYTLILNSLAPNTTSLPVNITVKPISGSTNNNWLNTATVPTNKGEASSTVVLYAKPKNVTSTETSVPGVECDRGEYYITGSIPEIGVGKWEFVGNSHGAYFENAFQNNTRVLGLQVGQSISVVWMVTNGTCASTSSPPILLTRPAAPTATISGGGNLCAGAPITSAQNITIALTGVGPWRIKYLDASGLEMTLINIGTPGATSYNYIFTPANEGTYTMISVSDSQSHSWTVGGITYYCPGISNGAAQLIFYTTEPIGGTINYSGGTVCAGETLPSALSLSGHLGMVWQWESSSNNVSWTPIAGTANITSFSPVITQNTYYRVNIRGGSVGGTLCFPDKYSGSMFVMVKSCNDIAIENTVSDTTPDSGETITFTVKVTNQNLVNATGVTVYDKLPNGYGYVGNSLGASYNPATGMWNIGNLNAGQSVTLVITAAVNSAGQYVSNAEVQCNETEIEYGNNSAQAGTTPNCDIRNISPKVN